MRFSQAWAEVAKQNNVLRVAVLGVSFVSVVVLMISLKFAFKEPLLIERGCFTSASPIQSQVQTPEEIESFIKEALAQRFNSDSLVVGDYFSLEEIKNRENEQAELKRREIKQKLVVNTIKKQGDDYLADTDRILSVGQIRSAFQMPVVVTVAKNSRTSGNPYGLVLVKVAALKTEEKKDGK